jgi:hypothetical protein
VGAVGLTVTASAIACTLVPSPEAADGLAAVAKLVLASAVLIASGVLIWIMARRNEAASNARASVGVK